MGDRRCVPPLALLDWKRQIHELYALIREHPDPKQAWWAWRERRDELFREHPASPLAADEKEGFTGLSYFDYDPSFRVLARWEEIPAERVEVAGSTASFTLERVARLAFTLASGEAAVDLHWIGGYGGGAFVPVRDATSGKTTYGGGRYVLDTIKGADLGTVGDKLALDFNFAYSPSCSYDPGWSCPLAPDGNRLEVAITAGERLRSESLGLST